MQNFVDPAILFFVFGVIAGALRSNLEIPQAIAKFLSLYLLMALGLKGGFALAQSGFTLTIALSLGAALLMAFIVPAIGYGFLRTGCPASMRRGWRRPTRCPDRWRPSSRPGGRRWTARWPRRLHGGSAQPTVQGVDRPHDARATGDAHGVSTRHAGATRQTRPVRAALVTSTHAVVATATLAWHHTPPGGRASPRAIRTGRRSKRFRPAAGRPSTQHGEAAQTTSPRRTRGG